MAWFSGFTYFNFTNHGRQTNYKIAILDAQEAYLGYFNYCCVVTYALWDSTLFLSIKNSILAGKQMNQNNQQIDQIFHQAVAKNKGYEIGVFSEEEKARYLNGFSMGAFIFGLFYFWNMRDRLLFWLSFLGNLFVPIVILILPFFARRRAYELRQFEDFSEFKYVQSRWDTAGWIGLLLIIISFIIVLYYIWLIISQSSLFASYSVFDIPGIYKSLQELLEI